MTRPFHPFVPAPHGPPSPAARGCLAALTVAGAAALVGLGISAFLATTYAVAHGAPPARAFRVLPPIAGPAVDLTAARRSWGDIRARYRDTHRRVPA